MRKYWPPLVAGIMIFSLTASLYGPYLSSPPFFDDIYFFLDPEGYLRGLSAASVLDKRWISTTTLALTYWNWGVTVEPFRLGSLVLHASVATSLFIFLRDLVSHQLGKPASLAAFSASLLFALHPVAAFAAGYLIERSILLASLFSLCMWIAVHRGVVRQHRGWLLLSVLFFYLAVFSKEHAITALPVALLVGWNAAEGNLRKTMSTLAVPLALWVLIALTIILRLRGIVGSAYEPSMDDMVQDGSDPHSFVFYLRSAVNQGWLFFKYALFWVIPYENWMAVDMREPFPPTWHALPWLGGALAFIAYPLVAGYAVLRQQISRLVGIALVAPWLLFLTMFSAVQYQESFVLYRSYLWVLPAMLLPALVLARLPLRQQCGLLVVLGVFYFGLSWSRLQTFSNDMLICNEMVERLNGREDLPGTYRVFHNRGLAYMRMDMYQRALADFNKAVGLNPAYPFTYNDRGATYLKLGQYEKALADYDHVIALKPGYPLPYAGRGLTFLKLGQRHQGLEDLLHACNLGVACKKYREELGKNSGANPSAGP